MTAAAVVHDAARPPFQMSMTAASGAGSLASPADAVGHAGVLALIGVGFVAAGIVLVLRGRRRRRPSPGPVSRRRWWQR
jgi:hypothetical protein